MLRLASASCFLALMVAGLSQTYGQPPEMVGCTLSAGPALSVPYAALLPPGAWELHWETLLATQQLAKGAQSQPLTHELVVLQAAAGTAGSAGMAVQETAAGIADLIGTAQAAGIASQDLTADHAGTFQTTAAGTATAAGSAAVGQGAADGKILGGTAGGTGGGGGGSSSIACGGLLSSDWILYLRKGSTDAAVFRQVV